eukprot:TRINITY_DN3581_c0_g2_i1.p1 TRINITY_DN3581_c0_g2~~TRINITY_DN3581_c0_g2_i1.p1  ORF type:complete len:469 (+),score=193.92 TRINITY_DN3581_c0_g2_i1:138-1409(+)
MISSLFILSTGGCIVIEKHWRRKLPRQVADDFYTEHVLPCESVRDVLPVISSGKYTFVHVLHCDLIFLAVINQETPVMMVAEAVQRIVDILDSYLDDVTEESLRDHFVTTYELLEEMLDDGFPMSFDPGLLKDLVPPPSLSKLFDRLRSDTSVPLTALDTSQVPWRKPGIKYANNEVFFDLVESLHTVIDGDGKTLQSSVDGVVECNCMLSGMPELLVNFTNSEVIDDASFHTCVNVKKFEQSKVLQFYPPDGKFRLMHYSIASDTNAVFQAPFYVTPQIGFSEGGGRVSLMVGTKMGSMGEKDQAITDIKLVVPLPSTVDSCSIETTQGSAMFDFSTKEIVWEVGKLGKGKNSVSPSLTANLHVRSDAPKPSVTPPVIVDFKQNLTSLSGLKFDHVTLLHERYKPYKGYKSMTKAGHFIIRS